MGNVFAKKRNAQFSRDTDKSARRISSDISNRRSFDRVSRQQFEQLFPPSKPPAIMWKRPSMSERPAGESSGGKVLSAKKKYALIPDNFTTLDQV